MQFSPSITLRRFVVSAQGGYVYDESFHQGINILRGENSSGKSTVLNLIFYALGGNVFDWSDHALRCDSTFAEVSLSGTVVTLSRHLAAQRGQAMEVYPGPLNDALAAPRASWSRYSYARNEAQEREGFSQVIFRLLGMPEAAAEQSGNVTMHQVLRLLYADQLSPVDSIFRFEQFDQPALRDAVGRLLCGAYDNEQYANRLQIRKLERELDEASAEQRSLFRVLGRSEGSQTLEWLAAERMELDSRQRALQNEISVLEKRFFEQAADDVLSLEAMQRAYDDTQQLQSVIANLREELDTIDFEIADNDRFVDDLALRLKALNSAEAITQEIGDVRFQFCPACYAPIDDGEHSASCHLCKTPHDHERSKLRIASLIADTGLQLSQARRIQKERTQRRESIMKEYDGRRMEWGQAARRLSSLSQVPSSETRSQLSELQRQVGYLERERDDLSRREDVARIIDEVSRNKEEINRRISQLKERNASLVLTQERRLAASYTAIADQVRSMLRTDLPRQDEFRTAKSIEFSFESNHIHVDGQSYFSASSRVILRNSFFSGFLFAAANDPKFRHLRFCLMDSIEDKGMEQARSHNYQNSLLTFSKASTSEHQMIFGTSMISPDLDSPEYTVGKFSSEHDKMLNLSHPTMELRS